MTSSAGGDGGEASVAPPLSLDHVKRELDLLHRGKHRTLRAALYAQLNEPLSGREVKVSVQGKEHVFRVVETQGELDLRRKLVREEPDTPTAYIVPFAKTLPRDLTAGFATGRVWLPREEWMLPRRFGARTGTHRLMASKLRQVAQRDAGPDYLSGDAPSVDLEDAWLIFLRKRLDVAVLETEAQLFWATLIERDGRGKALATLLAGVEGARKELADILVRRLGPSADPILSAWLEDSSVELAAMAVVGEATRAALSATDGSFALLTMALEMRIAQSGTHPLRVIHAETKSQGVARALLALSHLVGPLWERLRGAEHDPLRRAILKGAQSLLEKEQLRPLASSSTRLDFVFDERRDAFERAAKKVATANTQPATVEGVAEMDRAAQLLMQHENTKADPAFVKQIAMAQRLAAFCAEPLPPVSPSPRVETIQLARFQLEVGGWIDWARQVVRSDASGPLGKGLFGLVGRVDRIRDGLDTRFASAYARVIGPNGDRSLLGGVESIDGDNQRALPIEDAVSKLGLEWLAQKPSLRVLILCMDGMSTANLAELWSSMRGASLVPVSHGRRPPVIAHVPTLTRLSRSALFAGRALVPGDSTETKRDGERLAKHPEALKMSEQPVVLLRAEVLGEGGGLSDDAAKAVSGDRRIVGVVVNAIDDQLKGSTQMLVHVTRDSILPLGRLLDVAEQAGRLVLLASDHGNVSWHRFAGTTARPGSTPQGGARHRSLGANEAPAADEIAVPAGALGGGPSARLAVAVSETVRYSSLLHAGEHGGASLAEVIAPFVLLAPRGLLPELQELGLQETSFDPPPFWERDETFGEGPAVSGQTKATPKAVVAPDEASTAKAPAQRTLPFVGEPTEVSRGLFKTRLFREQTRNLGESELKQVQQALTLLLREAGGMTTERFALEMGLGRAARTAGFVVSLEQVLNVGGDTVIEVDRSTKRVVIDRRLLEEIFLGDVDD